MRFQTLDALRGLAALWVVLFHYPLSPQLKALAPWFARFAELGHFGVPMFFVISGYCIAAAATGAVARGGSSREFLRRRLLRIFPPFWASVALVAFTPYLLGAMSAVWGGSWVNYGGPAGPDGSVPVGEWLRVLTLTRGWTLDPAVDYGSLYLRFSGVYWTLAVEVQFYLVVAFALFVRKQRSAILAVVTVASLPFAALPDLWYYGPFIQFWPQFAAGMAVHAISRSGRTASAVLGQRLSVVMILGVAIGLLALPEVSTAGGLNHYQQETTFALGFAVLVWLVTAVDPQVEAVAKRRDLRGLAIRLLFGLGTISYSLYLLHTTLIRLVEPLGRRAFGGDSAVRDICTLLGLCLACVPFYYFFERPFVGSPRPPSRASSKKEAIPHTPVVTENHP